MTTTFLSCLLLYTNVFNLHRVLVKDFPSLCEKYKCQVVEREERARHRADSDGNRLLIALTLVGWLGGSPPPLCRRPGQHASRFLEKKKERHLVEKCESPFF
jgi:hypothetical protein